MSILHKPKLNKFYEQGDPAFPADYIEEEELVPQQEKKDIVWNSWDTSQDVYVHTDERFEDAISLKLIHKFGLQAGEFEISKDKKSWLKSLRRGDIVSLYYYIGNNKYPTVEKVKVIESDNISVAIKTSGGSVLDLSPNNGTINKTSNSTVMSDVGWFVWIDLPLRSFI
jgi:hypothetical protein